MRDIAIIGAGQAGLQLSIGLLKAGFKPSLYSPQTAEKLRNGSILSSPSMFHTALEHERGLGLNYWDHCCPQNTTVTYTLSSPNKASIDTCWQGRTSHLYQTVDQRLKFSRWIEEFIRLGGQFIVQNIGLVDLDTLVNQNDLVIVAAGKGEISQLFARDMTRSLFDKPQRALCCLYVKDMTPATGGQGVRVNVIPGVGEYFITPGLTLTGPCEMMLFEGLPGGPFDCWQGVQDATQRLEKAVELLEQFIPWEAERCQRISLTDSQATLQGSYVPIVREPVGKLATDKPVLGLGDTVVLNDPIGGQGANSTAKAAAFYLHEITAYPDHSFTGEWMRASFEVYWQQSARWSTQWTHSLLQPPTSLQRLFLAAKDQPDLADQLANAFDNPADLLSSLSSRV